MKIKLEIHDDAIDKLIIAELKGTLKHHTDPQWMDPDSPEIAAACKRLIKYYRPPK